MTKGYPFVRCQFWHRISFSYHNSPKDDSFSKYIDGGTTKMKNRFRKGAFRWASILLTVVMAVNLLPLTAMAADPISTNSGTGTKSDPYVYEVSSEAELNDALSAIRAETSATDFVISLTDTIQASGSFSIANTSSYSKNVTLLGNRYEIHFTQVGCRISIGQNVNVQFGASDNTDVLTISGVGGRNKGGADGPGFVTVQGTLDMYSGVTIKDYTTNNYYGGGVTVYAGDAVFRMHGGVIENCGVLNGSLCFGGGVGVFRGSTFIMDGGTIRNCFVESSYQERQWYYPTTAGGGVCVVGSTFIMNGGSIENCTAQKSTSGTGRALGGGVAVTASRTSYNANGGLGYLDSTFEMKGGEISGCTADYGGGICVLGTIVNNSSIGPSAFPDPDPSSLDDGFRINGGTIQNNTADAGGGIFAFYLNVFTARNGRNSISHIHNATITGNQATDDLGGGIYIGSCTLDLADSVFYDNTSAIGAADLFTEESTVKNLPSTMTTKRGKTYAWYWDHKQIPDQSYEYPAGTQNPCDRYSDDNRVAYTAIPSETEMRYLKAAESGYTVTFDLNYAGADASTAPSAQTVYSGQTADEPADPPTRDGYVFDGWYKDALCTQRYDFSSPVTANITLYAKWVQGLPHYILHYGDGRPGDGGDQYTFPYDPASPEKLPTEVKYFSQEEIKQLPEQSIYKGVTMEGTYFLAWYGYMPALASAINNNFPVLEKTGENTYTEISGTPAAGTTYFQFIPCETTPDTNLGDIIYYAQWVKVKVDIEVDIKVDVDVSFSENLGGKVVMIDDSQKLVLAKNFRPSDIVSNNCEITLTATVANPKIPAEEAKTAEYMAQNYPNCRSISYDVEITKDIVSGGSPYSSETLKKLAAPIEIRFAVPNEWQNGTVKMLRAHTDPGTGTVTVSECQNLSSDKSWFILSSDEFSTYTLLYIPSGGGTGGSGGGTSAYTLRYQSNGGTPCPDETKTSAWSKDCDSLPVPVREGYLFTGWFADSGLQTPISEDVQVNRRLVTIYAGWEKSMVPAMLNGDDHYAYVQGYSDGTARPNDNITRAEVATIFFRLLKDEIREENLSDVNTFEDVTDGMWCNKAISTMAVLGVVKGRTAEYFDPDAPITRGEFAAICSRFDKSDIVARENFTDIEGYWAKEEIERAAILGWVRGYTDGSFRPRNYITRAEAMTMINRVLHRVPESPEDLLPDMVTWPDNRPTDWYYLAVQEATNSHIPERKANGYESWSALTYNRDWSIYQS